MVTSGHKQNKWKSGIVMGNIDVKFRMATFSIQLLHQTCSINMAIIYRN